MNEGDEEYPGAYRDCSFPDLGDECPFIGPHTFRGTTAEGREFVVNSRACIRCLERERKRDMRNLQMGLL